MKKIFLFLVILLLSTTLRAEPDTQVLINGKNSWPPQGPRCDKFLRCCEKANQVDSSSNLFCKLQPAQKNFTCESGIHQVLTYLKELKKEAPPECIEVKAMKDS